ncbi:MAG: VOC family protein [Cyanobacteria bacterium SBLK]|nr:VOC family protein [Cyanobacteria bacterium SBLK]
MILGTIGPNSKKARQKLISALIAVVAVTFVLFGCPGLTAPANAGPGGTEVSGYVMRFNVSDIFLSVDWYTDVLDMDIDRKNTEFPYYTQVFYPEYPDTQIGLSASTPVQSGQATATIVVSDIKQAVDSLLSKYVEVSPLCNAGDGLTVLAFFCDPDGNNLALRENDVYYAEELPFCGAPICNNCK